MPPRRDARRCQARGAVGQQPLDPVRERVGIESLGAPGVLDERLDPRAQAGEAERVRARIER
jgi:hypothetical protein